jgi:hypothetical protein
LAPRWRLRPGRRAPRRFSGASVRAVSGPVLAGFGVFAGLRGSPGPAGVRRCDLRAAAGAVGRQGAVCPRLAAAGHRGEVPARSTPHQLVEAARAARSRGARRPLCPPACSRDSVGPAQAPQSRPEGAQAVLWRVCPRALPGPILARCGAFLASRRPSAADIDPECGAARPLGSGEASARQPRPLWSAAVRSARGGGGCRPARGRLSEALTGGG